MPHHDSPYIPLTASILTLLGAIPFVAAALLLTWPHEAISEAAAIQAVRVYGAVILSFLGGIHWGIALPRLSMENDEEVWHSRRILVTGIAPPLIGWIAALLPAEEGIGLLILGLLLTLLMDFRLIRHRDAPRWYGSMRGMITLIVVLSLATILGLMTDTIS